jgi:hypothetical protein
VTGTRVLATVAIAVFATAVIPPFSAWVVNHRRVSRAEADINAIVDRVRNAEPALRHLEGAVDVLCGPGRLPEATADARGWITAPRGSLAAVLTEHESLPIDPWGNCYLMNLRAMTAVEPSAVWVLSAGPNGIIETPFIAKDPAGPAGNDVGMRIR